MLGNILERSRNVCPSFVLSCHLLTPPICPLRSRSRGNTSSGSESENSNREHRKKRNRWVNPLSFRDSEIQRAAVLMLSWNICTVWIMQFTVLMEIGKVFGKSRASFLSETEIWMTVSVHSLVNLCNECVCALQVPSGERDGGFWSAVGGCAAKTERKNTKRSQPSPLTPPLTIVSVKWLTLLTPDHLVSMERLLNL